MRLAVNRPLLKRMVPQFLKARLSSGWKTASLYRDRFCSVDKEVLRRALLKLGLQSGEMVFVHAAYSQMRSIRATPLEIIEMLCQITGEAGTVVMPTFSMRGFSQSYLDRHPWFDSRRTPAQTGFLPEVFRRMAGTERSLHPTHSVAARGAAAALVTADHDRCRTPFDEHSPFHKLLERDAFILSLGSLTAMTFRHLADHLIQDQIPFPIYSDRETTVRLITRDGEERWMLTRGHNPNITCNHMVVLERMDREGLRRTGTAGTLRLSLLRARAYIEVYRRCHAERLIRYSYRPRTESNG